MRVFEHPNAEGFVCPICNTSEDKPVVLIGIDGTQEGYNIQARQYHIDCLELVEFQTSGNVIIAQILSKKVLPKEE